MKDYIGLEGKAEETSSCSKSKRRRNGKHKRKKTWKLKDCFKRPNIWVIGVPDRKSGYN